MNFQSRYGPGWVVITGGADGIGRAYAQYFAEKQFSVILIDRNSVLLNATVNDIKRRFKVKAHAIEADLSSYAFNPELYDGVYSRIKELVAGENVVGLINNVGVGYIEKFEKFPLEQLEKILISNQLPTVHLTRRLIPDMRQAKNAFTIFISSYSGLHSMPLIAPYGGTKGFVWAFAESLSQEIPELDVLVVTPMCVSTAMSHNVPADYTIATPQQVVYGSLKDLGRRRQTIGWWKHCVIDWLYTSMPSLFQEEYRSHVQNTQYDFTKAARILTVTS